MHPALTAPSPAAPRADGAPWSLFDAAKYLGVSLATVERAVRSGAIPSFKLGSRRLIADADLKRVAAGGPDRPAIDPGDLDLAVSLLPGGPPL